MPSEFGRAVVRTSARSSAAERHMARLNEPFSLSKSTKPVRLGIYRTQIRPNKQDILARSGQWLDLSENKDNRHSFCLANREFGYGDQELDEELYSQVS